MPYYCLIILSGVRKRVCGLQFVFALVFCGHVCSHISNITACRTPTLTSHGAPKHPNITFHIEKTKLPWLLWSYSSFFFTGSFLCQICYAHTDVMHDGALHGTRKTGKVPLNHIMCNTWYWLKEEAQKWRRYKRCPGVSRFWRVKLQVTVATMLLLPATLPVESHYLHD